MNNIYQEIIHGVFFISPKFAALYSPGVVSILKNEEKKSEENGAYKPSSESEMSVFDSYHKNQANFLYTKKFFENVTLLVPSASGGFHKEKGFDGLNSVPEGSTAVITISGPITKYDQPCGPDGMKTVARMSHDVLSNPNISQLIYQIESPGGSVYASQYMHGEIHRMKAQYSKPIIAYVEDLCASGGMYIASACDEVYANSENASIGSIGTMITLWDQSKYLEKEGIRLIELYATASTDKNKVYRDALSGKPEELIEELDIHNQAFINAIVTGRPKSATHIKFWETGKVFFAKDAFGMGLIDGIEPTIEDLIFKKQ